MDGKKMFHGTDGQCGAKQQYGQVYPKAPDDVVISTAIGSGGANAKVDVMRVQKALNLVPPTHGGPMKKLTENGVSGTDLVEAIGRFQQVHFAKSDGRVDVMGKTHAKLSGLQPSKIQLIAKAKPHFETAKSCVFAAQNKLLSAGLQLITGGGSNLELADKHFKITSSPNPALALAQVSRIYALIASYFSRPGGLWGESSFEADPFSESAAMFAWWGGYYLPGQYVGWQRLDTIYICPYMHGAPDSKWVNSIIHEVAHIVGPVAGDQIFDYAYGIHSSPRMANLTPYQKQHNARHFNNFAFDAKFGREHVD
jgi:hypothetical protein